MPQAYRMLALLLAFGPLLPSNAAVSRVAQLSRRASLIATADSLNCSSTTAQRAGLQLFFEAAGGHRWTNSSGWSDGSSDHCLWFGVSCMQGLVQSLTLDNNMVSDTSSHGALLHADSPCE